MTEPNVYMPFFTAPDPELLRADTGRDPLGLLPVWGEFGRKLVPVIAGPVSHLEGIKAVLLIYHTYAVLYAQGDARQAVSLRRHFRLMEGLLEFYLHQTKRHCYGSRALASDDFSVRRDDSSTAVNGLYQYYRGTCARAELLQDGALSDQTAATLAASWDASVNPALAQVLRDCANNGQRPLAPRQLLCDRPALGRSLDACFASPALNQLLFERLFGGPAHHALARHCAAQRKQSDPASKDLGPVLSLVTRLRAVLADSEADDRARELDRQLEYVTRCEPFLVTVQDGFDLLRNAGGGHLADVAARLRPYQAQIRARARDFRQIDAAAKSARSRKMLALAAAAADGVPAFLDAILAHHASVAQERGRDPMVRYEGASILSMSEAERDSAAILQRLKQGYPWDNGYYLSTAGNLYEQSELACRD